MTDMRFTLNGLDRDNVNIEEYAESLRRAKALADNPQIILDLFGDKEKRFGVDYYIECYTDEYADEFFVKRFSHANNMIQTAHIEILTAQSAESNEKEEIMGGCVIGVDNTTEYKLGETVQSYLPVGDSGYWYREM